MRAGYITTHRIRQGARTEGQLHTMAQGNCLVIPGRVCREHPGTATCTRRSETELRPYGRSWGRVGLRETAGYRGTAYRIRVIAMPIERFAQARSDVSTGRLRRSAVARQQRSPSDNPNGRVIRIRSAATTPSSCVTGTIASRSRPTPCARSCRSRLRTSRDGSRVRRVRVSDQFTAFMTASPRSARSTFSAPASSRK